MSALWDPRSALRRMSHHDRASDEAGAHGNRTRRATRPRRPTNFEDWAGHQSRSRSHPGSNMLLRAAKGRRGDPKNALRKALVEGPRLDIDSLVEKRRNALSA